MAMSINASTPGLQANPAKPVPYSNEALVALAKASPKDALENFKYNKQDIEPFKARYPEVAAALGKANPALAAELGLIPKPEVKPAPDQNKVAPGVKPSNLGLDPNLATVSTSEAELNALFGHLGKSDVTTKPVVAPAPAPQPSQVTVKSGDTLSKIAAAAGISLATLRELNPDLFKAGNSQGHARAANGNRIFPGDIVKLPPKPGTVAATGAIAPPSPQVAAAQSTLINNLKAELGKLQAIDKELSQNTDPARATETGARRALLAERMGGLTHELNIAQNFKLPADASPKDQAAIVDMFGKMNAMIPAFSDPTKVSETQANLAALGNLLHNPSLYDSKALFFTQDSVIKNQAVAVQNLQGRISSLIGQAESLIPEPGKAMAPDAMAKFQVLGKQVNELTHVANELKTYQRPANLTPEQAAAQAAILGNVEGTAKGLTDSGTHEAAVAKVRTLLTSLKSASEGAKAEPVKTGSASVAQSYASDVAELNKLLPAFKADMAAAKKEPAKADLPKLQKQGEQVLSQFQKVTKEFEQLPADERTKNQASYAALGAAVLEATSPK